MLQLLFIVFGFTPVSDNDLQTGIRYFNSRAENAVGLQANPANIDKAISVFAALIKEDKDLKEAGGYYMQSLNFKGRFVYNDEKNKRAMYTQAIVLGNELVIKYPNDGRIRFELISAIGLLAEINGVMKSAEDGVLAKLVHHTNVLIQTDSMYSEGGGWKIYAALNYKTPYIPFILVWPNKKRAEAVMKNALRHFPANIGCNFYYAEALYENNKKKLAAVYFELCTKLPPRKNSKLEDEYFKVKAREYLKKL